MGRLQGEPAIAPWSLHLTLMRPRSAPAGRDRPAIPSQSRRPERRRVPVRAERAPHGLSSYHAKSRHPPFLVLLVGVTLLSQRVENGCEFLGTESRFLQN